MTWTSIRLLITGGLLLAVGLFTSWLRGKAEVQMPVHPIRELPAQLGTWQGRDEDLDPGIAQATGADDLINRRYVADGQPWVSLHAAVHADPEKAIIHSPFLCYRGQGYRLLGEQRMTLPGPDDKVLSVSYSTWEDSQKRRVRVLFWFQWGEYTFYDRWDRQAVHAKMRGLPQWPAIIKVLLETPATNDEKADEERIRGFGGQVFSWIVANSGLPQPTAE